VVEDDPDPAHVSMSYVERRSTRLTNAFSKRFQNHVHSLALYFAFYNFLRIHKTLRMSPAMAAGVGKTALDDGRHCGAD